MWARLRKKIDLEDRTPLVDEYNLGCTQRVATVDEESFKTKTDLFQIITASNVHENPKKEASAWGCDKKGHAEQCVERCCDLSEKCVFN